MILVPTQQYNKSMFCREQTPFMAEVQPPVPLYCEDLTNGEVIATKFLCTNAQTVQTMELLCTHIHIPT